MRSDTSQTFMQQHLKSSQTEYYFLSDSKNVENFFSSNKKINWEDLKETFLKEFRETVE